MLLEKGVVQANIDSHLTITQGDVLNVEDCKDVLTRSDRSVDIIISGVGTTPGGPEITLCTNAVKNIFSALRSLKTSKKPFFIALSTTGITSTGPRDVPLLFAPLYHLMLANPHKDKKEMEAAVVKHAASTDSVIRGHVLVRPSLLTNGKAQGANKVKVGSDEKPMVGYTISRNDVGLWMFENLVQGDGMRYSGQKPTITY